MNIRVMYLRDDKGRPVGCVAIELKKSNSASPLAMYQLSVLNPLDRFDRAVARQLAKGRLTEAPFTVRLKRNPNMHDVTEAVMRDMWEDKHMPTRARKAARLWLRGNLGR